MSRPRNKLPAIIVAVLGIAISIVLVCLTQNSVDITGWAPAPDDALIIDGVSYEERPNLEKYLIVGVDSELNEEYDFESAAPGLCDAVYLLVIDTTQDSYAVVSLDRDLRAPVYTYDEEGEQIAVSQIQLSFAHSHGYTEEMASYGVKETVSALLKGIRIDGIATLGLDSIGIINNIVGGVTVTIDPDFSRAHPELRAGSTVRLNDEQAVSFVRGRKSVGQGTNAERIQRQQQFILGAGELFVDNFRNDPSFVDDAVSKLGDKLYTDISNNSISRIANALAMCEDRGTYVVSGKSTKDEDGWNLIIPDEDSINEILTDLILRKAD